jgi:hypothetical protein
MSLFARSLRAVVVVLARISHRGIPFGFDGGPSWLGRQVREIRAEDDVATGGCRGASTGCLGRLSGSPGPERAFRAYRGRGGL